MPYLWTDPDVFLSHGGVDVYYIYPDDLANDPPRERRFGFDPVCSDDCDEFAFDVDDVALLLPDERRALCAGDTTTLLMALIDTGVLTAEGVVINGETYTDAASIRAAVISAHSTEPRADSPAQ